MAKANTKRATARTQPKLKPTATEKLLSSTKLSAESRAYGQGCVEGEKRAELYLKELRQEPGCIGMPLMGSYLRKIRPYPKNAKVSGLLVGFTARVEREFARLVVDDIWRLASSTDRWRIANELAERKKDPKVAKKLVNDLIECMKAGKKPTPADWEELLGSLDEKTMARVEKAVDELHAQQKSEDVRDGK